MIPPRPPGYEGSNENFARRTSPAVDELAPAEAAAKYDVEVLPLSRYAHGKARRDGIVLGFASVDGRELRRGVEQLARALEECRS